MKHPLTRLLLLSSLLVTLSGGAQQKTETSFVPDKKQRSGNPIIPESVGHYADPHAMIYEKRWWIYPTTSLPFAEQTSFDCFSSRDLLHWERHEKILRAADIRWARSALWAPASVENNGRYYLFFVANNIPYGAKEGCIGVAVADRPEGPYRDLIGRPLIGVIANGAQPIDQCLLNDDGNWYLYYGGWGHCNVVKLRPDFTGVEAFEVNGTVYNAGGSLDPEQVRFLEVTPEAKPRYTEGPFIFKRSGKYYFMWSEGNFTDSTYNVAYAISDSPFGPFRREGTVFLRDEEIGSGAGHHSIVQIPGREEWYIFYHRREHAGRGAHERMVCVERMEFDANGRIIPIRITREGVPRRRIR